MTLDSSRVELQAGLTSGWSKSKRDNQWLPFLLLIGSSDAVFALQPCASVPSLSNDSKLDEMIPTRGMKPHLGSGIGHLFEIQIACLSLYRHNIENLVTDTHARTKKNLWRYWTTAQTFKYERGSAHEEENRTIHLIQRKLIRLFLSVSALFWVHTRKHTHRPSSIVWYTSVNTLCTSTFDDSENEKNKYSNWK